MNLLWNSHMIRLCGDMGQGQQAMCPEAFLHIWVPGSTSRDGCCTLFATGLISHFSSNFASWEHLNVSAGPFYTTWKTLKLSGCHKHIFLFCSSNKQLCPTVIDFPNKNPWSSSLVKYALSGTQQMEFPQVQLCKKCVRECVYMCVCVCILSYYLYCANYLNLGILAVNLIPTIMVKDISLVYRRSLMFVTIQVVTVDCFLCRYYC